MTTDHLLLQRHDAPRYKLVPVEPTETMLDAGRSVSLSGVLGIYHAMLAAEPDLALSLEPVAWRWEVYEQQLFKEFGVSIQKPLWVADPLYAVPPDAAAIITKLDAENETLRSEVDRLAAALEQEIHISNERGEKLDTAWANLSAANTVFESYKKGSELIRAALVGLVGADSEDELRQMEAVIRLLPDPDSDKAVTINAIHALLATGD